MNNQAYRPRRFTTDYGSVARRLVILRLNTVRRESVSADHGLGDVLLQGFQKCATLGQDLIDGLDRDFLQRELIDRLVIAVHLCGARFQATDAAPDAYPSLFQ